MSSGGSFFGYGSGDARGGARRDEGDEGDGFDRGSSRGGASRVGGRDRGRWGGSGYEQNPPRRSNLPQYEQPSRGRPGPRSEYHNANYGGSYPPSPPPPAPVADPLEAARLELENKKIELEKMKIELEMKKMEQGGSARREREMRGDTAWREREMRGDAAWREREMRGDATRREQEMRQDSAWWEQRLIGSLQDAYQLGRQSRPRSPQSPRKSQREECSDRRDPPLIETRQRRMIEQAGPWEQQQQQQHQHPHQRQQPHRQRQQQQQQRSPSRASTDMVPHGYVGRAGSEFTGDAGVEMRGRRIRLTS